MFIKVYVGGNGKSQQDYHGAKAILYAVALSPDKQKLVAVGERGTVVLFDVKTGTLLQRFVGHEANKHVRTVAFDPLGKWFVTAGDDKQILLWLMSKEQPIKKWQVDGEVWALAVDSTGNVLASAGSDKIVTLWNIETGEKQQTLSGHKAIITGLSFSPNDELLASTSYDDTIRLWQVSDGQVRYQLRAHTDKCPRSCFQS
jgi:WD40 repeat protein